MHEASTETPHVFQSIEDCRQKLSKLRNNPRAQRFGSFFSASTTLPITSEELEEERRKKGGSQCKHQAAFLLL